MSVTGLTGPLNVHLPIRRPNPHPTRLTATETWVMELIANEAMSTPEIAVEMGIRESTVKVHLKRVMDKTGYSTKLELAVRTLQKRLPEGKPERVDAEFFKAVQGHLRGLSKTQCGWLLDAIEMYAIRLRAGKFQPARAEYDDSDGRA